MTQSSTETRASAFEQEDRAAAGHQTGMSQAQVDGHLALRPLVVQPDHRSTRPHGAITKQEIGWTFDLDADLSSVEMAGIGEDRGRPFSRSGPS